MRPLKSTHWASRPLALTPSTIAKRQRAIWLRKFRTKSPCKALQGEARPGSAAALSATGTVCVCALGGSIGWRSARPPVGSGARHRRCNLGIAGRGNSGPGRPWSSLEAAVNACTATMAAAFRTAAILSLKSVGGRNDKCIAFGRVAGFIARAIVGLCRRMSIGAKWILGERSCGGARATGTPGSERNCERRGAR
jgi:hypothetical protein